MGQVWRLLVHGPCDGALNMALDRAVQMAREEGSAPPTLRLYAWARPTVTLGRFQRREDVDAAYCESHGIDIVRRHTGGRGVLHDDELTYAVVASTDDGVPRGVSASYRFLCGALVESYRALGARAELTQREHARDGAAACYLHTSRADLSAGGAKLSGSAQVWHGTTVLQHGSFVVSRDTARKSAAFRLDAQQRERLAEQTATLADLLGESPARSTMIEAVTAGFERALGVWLVPGELSACEAETAARLLG